MKNINKEMNTVLLIRSRAQKRILIHMMTSILSLSILSSCVNVAAPDKPIVIQLNVKIEQEVVIRVAEAVDEAIEDNAGIF